MGLRDNRTGSLTSDLNEEDVDELERLFESDLVDDDFTELRKPCNGLNLVCASNGTGKQMFGQIPNAAFKMQGQFALQKSDPVYKKLVNKEPLICEGLTENQ